MDHGKFVAWPFDVLDARILGGTGVHRDAPFPPWISAKAADEMFVMLGSGHEVSDYGSDDGHADDDGGSSAATTAGMAQCVPVRDRTILNCRVASPRSGPPFRGARCWRCAVTGWGMLCWRCAVQ